MHKLPLLFVVVFAGIAAGQIGPAAVNNAPPKNALNVKTACAARGDGAEDDTNSLQFCIKRAKPGQTVYFPNGTYKVTRKLDMKGGITLLGQSTGAVLHQDDTGEYLIEFPWGGANDITLSSLTFDNGGIGTNGNGEIPKRIRITNCKFQNLTDMNPNWTKQHFIYADNGLSDSKIDHNSFYMLLGNGATRVKGNIDYDGDLPRSAIFAFGLHKTSIDHNTFDHIYEGIRNCQVFPFKTEDVYIGWNTMTHIHRMGMEIQDANGCGHQGKGTPPINSRNYIIENNSITDWDDYYWTSFGISFANTPVETVIVRNNLIIAPEYYDAPGVPAAHRGIGIEVGGRPAKVYNNLLKGPWGPAIALFSGSAGSEVHNNWACAVDVKTAAPTIADEMNPAPTDTHYFDNITAYPCPEKLPVMNVGSSAR